MPKYCLLKCPAGEDQQRIFQPSGKRRVIVSTNIAETSPTLPGIRFVDTGLDVSVATAHRPILADCQSSRSHSNANQRKGRCKFKRVLPLYSEKDFDGRLVSLP